MSATTIKVNCPTCGPQHLGSDDVVLELGSRLEGVADTFRFICPGCGELKRRGAGARVIHVLLAVGVAREKRITEGEIERFALMLDRLVDPIEVIRGFDAGDTS